MTREKELRARAEEVLPVLTAAGVAIVGARRKALRERIKAVLLKTDAEIWKKCFQIAWALNATDVCDQIKEAAGWKDE